LVFDEILVVETGVLRIYVKISVLQIADHTTVLLGYSFPEI
jgi:hypothetical protein